MGNIHCGARVCASFVSMRCFKAGWIATGVGTNSVAVNISLGEDVQTGNRQRVDPGSTARSRGTESRHQSAMRNAKAIEYS